MFIVQRCLSLVAAAFILTAATEWQPLFDGKSLQGWKETPFSGHAAVKIENAQILLPYGKPMTGITLTREFPTIELRGPIRSSQAARQRLLREPDLSCRRLLCDVGDRRMGRRYRRHLQH